MALLTNKVSVFKQKIYLPFACLIARLFAEPKPELIGFLIMLIFENSCSIASIEPSLEALSTTKIS